ncbi:MAG: glycoside hydrolase family 9 protein [Bacteroidia bacterium]|nr:glycoside hydrolase family 9 protein [Bacteroidia bacterium]
MSHFIHVDQFGYQLEATKVAVISDPQNGYNANVSFNPSAMLDLVDMQTNQVVMSVAPQSWDNGAVHEESGDRGWWVDFSSFKATGNYYLEDRTSGERSPIFSISENPYEEVLKQAGRAFFYNRCNAEKKASHAGSKWADGMNFSNPLQDKNARYIYSPNDAATEKDLSGGWFDAGDYNKYVSFTQTTLQDLMSAYEEHPNAFSDNWNIPESGNGIPDVIDEVIWELKWLEKMQNPDGSAHIKMGSKNYSENTSSPPSANIDPRYYGPTCTSASLTLATIFARASIILDAFPAQQSYANDLLAKAKLSFDYALPYYINGSLELNCDDGSIVSGDADLDLQTQTNLIIEAAINLFLATADPAYNNFIVDNYQQHYLFVNNYVSYYQITSIDAFFRYSSATGANQVVKQAFNNLLDTAVGNNWESFFGFNDLDLYRAFIPSYSYHWGSNQAIASLANLNLLLAKNNVLGDSLSYATKAAEQLHYFHGVNPQSMVYLSNMYDYGAERSVNEIYHTWFNDGTDYDHALNSPKGPAPGFLVGGSNKDFSYANLSPPYNQPAQKAFLDFNTGWPESSWEITEPGIYYQAAYVRLLAAYVDFAQIPNSVQPIRPKISLKLFPNPTNDILHIQGIPETGVIELYDAMGRQVQSKTVPKGEAILKTQGLAAGAYHLRFIRDGKISFGEMFIKK